MTAVWRAQRNGPKGPYLAPVVHLRRDCPGFSPHSIKVEGMLHGRPELLAVAGDRYWVELDPRLRLCRKCGGGPAGTA